MKKNLATVCSALLLCALPFAAPQLSAAPLAITGMTITGGSQWGLLGTSSSTFNFVDIGANTNLVGGYIGSSGTGYPNGSSFAPADAIAVLRNGTFDFGYVYTAAANLGDSAMGAGTLAGGPVASGTIDPITGVMQMDLSSWFFNDSTDDYEYAQGVPNATGVANCVGTSCTYTLSWQRSITHGEFVSHIGFWTIEGTATTVVPIPGAAWLLASGLFALTAARVRRR